MQIRDLIPWGSNKGSEIAKSDQGNPVFSLQRDVNRIFEDFWKRLDQPFGAFGRWDTGGPRMDVTETESAIEVSVELPGIDQKDVDVSLTDSALTIKGEKKSEQEESKKGITCWNAPTGRSTARSRYRRASTRTKSPPSSKTAS